MATKMGVREFRDGFTTIARDAKEPVIVTNHDKVVGWFTPAKRSPRSVAEILDELSRIRREVEARGVDVAGRLKKLGLEDDELFDDPQLNVPGGMVDVSLPDGRVTRIPALPLQFGSQRLGLRRDIPRAGEHSIAIAQELGMDSSSIEALIASGVLGVDTGA